MLEKVTVNYSAWVKLTRLSFRPTTKKTDNSKSAPVTLFSPPPKLEVLKVVDKGQETDPLAFGRNEEMTQRIEIIEKAQHADPVPSNLANRSINWRTT